MSFSTALSGLNAASADLNVKSNNIANVSTTGFKQSRAEFGDVFAVSAFGSSSGTAIGSGVVLQNVAQQFNQGNLEFTDNSLDLAISGEGFFAMAPSLESGEIIYTRAGEFGIDKDGYMVNSQGNFLRTFPVDANGIISATSMSAAKPLQLPTSAGEPESTSLLSIASNVPSNATGKFDDSAATPATIGTSTITVGTAAVANDTIVVNGVTFTFAENGGADAFVIADNAVTIQATLGGDVAADSAQLIADAMAAYKASGVAGTDDLDDITAVDAGSVVTLTYATAGLPSTNSNTISAPTGTLATTSVLDASGADIGPSAPLAINPLDPTTYTNSTSATIYDSLGNEHIITTYYQKIDGEAEVGGVPVGDNQWKMEAYISADDIKVVAGVTTTQTDGATTLVKLGATNQVSFNTDGTLNATIPDPITMSFAPGTGTEFSSGASDQDVTLNLAGSTQNSGGFSVGGLTVNGFPTGRLTGVDISDDGLIRATYSNGQANPIGKIALGNFANVQALNKIGSTAWKETTDSGPVIAGEAGTGSFGQIQSGALETSNVDLTKELVGLITAQRNFQANSKAIETNNAITQTIIQLR